MVHGTPRRGMSERTPRIALAGLLSVLLFAACDTDAVSPWDTASDAASELVWDAAIDTDTATVSDSATVSDAVTVSDAALDTTWDAALDTTWDAALAAAPDAAKHGPVPAPWRSALYPEDWVPSLADAEGRFLHDFSWAGYRNGEAPGAFGVADYTVDVVADFGVDPSGLEDATAAIQAAIDDVSAAGGGVVHFPEGLYRVAERLWVRHSHVVLRGAGPDASRLVLTKHAGAAYVSQITFTGALAQGPDRLLSADAATWQTEIPVDDMAGLAVGDDVVLGFVITPDFVEQHGMTGTWRAFNDTWQPMFWRTVVAVHEEPPAVVIDVPLRFAMRTRDGASLRLVTGMLREVGFESLGFTNAGDWDEAWAQNQLRVLEMNGVKDAWIRRVASFPSPLIGPGEPGEGAHLSSGGVNVRQSKRVTVEQVSLGRALNRGPGGNGYLFEVRQSSEILFRDCEGQEGRHNFIQNWGFGLTGCVWLRVRSAGGRAYESPDGIFKRGLSDFHHSLASANLVDSSVLDDGWAALNRQHWSTGAGLSASENVFWNTSGAGYLKSYQYGWGYVVGTAPRFVVHSAILGLPDSQGTEPEDWVEGLGQGATLDPPSLYEDQLARRLGNPASGSSSCGQRF